MKYLIVFCGLGFLVACGGEKKDTTAPAAVMGSPVDMGMAAEPVPSPGGRDQPGACRNVGVPSGSACRLSSLRLQHCPSCAPDRKLYRSGHLVPVDGTDHGFESGGYLIPADREAEFKQFMQKNSPVPCGGIIVHPPCNPAATHMELELAFPDWIRREP